MGEEARQSSTGEPEGSASAAAAAEAEEAVSTGIAKRLEEREESVPRTWAGTELDSHRRRVVEGSSVRQEEASRLIEEGREGEEVGKRSRFQEFRSEEGEQRGSQVSVVRSSSSRPAEEEARRSLKPGEEARRKSCSKEEPERIGYSREAQARTDCSEQPSSGERERIGH